MNGATEALSTFQSLYGGGGGGGGGGGYGGDIKSDIRSGGANKGIFGAVVFGDGNKVGGATDAEGSTPNGTNNTLLWVSIGLSVVGLILFLRR